MYACIFLRMYARMHASTCTDIHTWTCLTQSGICTNIKDIHTYAHASRNEVNFLIFNSNKNLAKITRHKFQTKEINNLVLSLRRWKKQTTMFWVSEDQNSCTCMCVYACVRVLQAKGINNVTLIWVSEVQKSFSVMKKCARIYVCMYVYTYIYTYVGKMSKKIMQKCHGPWLHDYD